MNVSESKDNKNLRKSARFEIPIQLRPTKLFGKEGRIQNISMGGVRIFGTKNIDVGTILKIDFSLSDDKWITAEILVVWVRKRPSESILKYDLGCMFVEIPPDSQKILFEHITKISLD